MTLLGLFIYVILIVPASAVETPPEVEGAPVMRAESCGDERLCFYNPDGTLSYWASSFWTEVYPDAEARRRRLGVRRRVVITGGYAPLERRQREYDAWVKRHAPNGSRTAPGISFVPEGRFGWGARGVVAAPHYLPPNGTLSLRTLKAPLFMAAREISILWGLIQGDIERALPERGFAMNFRSLEWMVWDPTRADAIPDPMLRLKARAVYEAYRASGELGHLVDSLEPLTEGWKEVTDPRWRMYVLPDHLEPDQLPPGFMDRLAGLERELAKAVEDAAVLVEP
jgi:hypothetical protein